jgi:hypothetical protein
VDSSGVTRSWLRWWADLLDSRFRVPGTRIRFGIDPVLSLIPGLGDMASPVFTLVLLVGALRRGVPRIILVRMVLNAALDALIGAVPIAGSVGDVFWRANTANLALLERHTRAEVPPTAGDRLFVAVIAGLLGLFMLGPLVLTLWLAAWLWQAL